MNAPRLPNRLPGIAAVGSTNFPARSKEHGAHPNILVSCSKLDSQNLAIEYSKLHGHILLALGLL